MATLQKNHKPHARIWIAALLTFTFSLPVIADPIFSELKRQQLLKPIPDDLDTSTHHSKGVFEISYQPEGSDTPPFNEMHSWLVQVHSTEQELANLQLEVVGDMPLHRHGLPTQPTVEKLAPGRFRVSGLRFHMPGWWRMSMRVFDSNVSETIAFDLNVN